MVSKEIAEGNSKINRITFMIQELKDDMIFMDELIDGVFEECAELCANMEPILRIKSNSKIATEEDTKKLVAEADSNNSTEAPLLTNLQSLRNNKVFSLHFRLQCLKQELKDLKERIQL